MIRSIKFNWATEWLPRIRECRTRMKAAMAGLPDGEAAIAGARACGDWQRETDAWLRTFDADLKYDVTDLLLAESFLLFDLIDPGKGPKPGSDSDTGADFRERFYDALPLANAAERLLFPKSSEVLRSFYSLRDYAEKRGWLP